MKVLQTIFLLLVASSAATAQKPGRTAGRGYQLYTHAAFTAGHPPPARTLIYTGRLDADSAGRRLFSAGYKHHQLDGPWESWYPNGNRCDSGVFRKGLPDGEWRFYTPSGELRAIRHYSADKFQRVAIEMRIVHPTKVLYPITRLYQRDPKAATKFLQASWSFDDLAPVSFPSLEDQVEINASHPAAYRPVFTSSLHHGLFINFRSDGLARDSGYFEDGLKQGAWVHRDTDGTVYAGRYRNGFKSDDWRAWWPDGRMRYLLIYDEQGGLVSKKENTR